MDPLLRNKRHFNKTKTRVCVLMEAFHLHVRGLEKDLLGEEAGSEIKLLFLQEGHHWLFLH